MDEIIFDLYNNNNNKNDATLIQFRKNWIRSNSKSHIK